MIILLALQDSHNSLSLQQHQMAFQKQKREQDLKEFSPKKTVPTQIDLN